MKTKELLKYFISCGAVIYTVGSVLILAISLAVSDSSAQAVVVPKPFFFLLGFSYVISLGNTLYRLDSLSKTARRILHALCYVIGFFTFLLLCGVDFAFSVIFTAIFSAVYAAAIFISALVKKGSNASDAHKSVSATADQKSKGKKMTKQQKTDETRYHNRFS